LSKEVSRLTAADALAFVVLLGEVSRESRWIATEWPFDTVAVQQRAAAGYLSGSVIGFGVRDGLMLLANLDLRAPHSPYPEVGMMVTAAQRGRGLGRALLSAAADWAREHGADGLLLWVLPDNEAAIGLYRSVGFVEEELEPGSVPRRHGPAIDALRMRLTFSAGTPVRR
jgi:GNAT superfamily N-acetyltransferase